MEPSSVTENIIQHRLKAALEALDVHLEDEIEQYRAHRPAQDPGSSPTPTSSQVSVAPTPSVATVLQAPLTEPSGVTDATRVEIPAEISAASLSPQPVPKLNPPPPPPMFNRPAAVIPTAAVATPSTPPAMSTPPGAAVVAGIAGAAAATTGVAATLATQGQDDFTLLGGENFDLLPDIDIPDSPFSADLAGAEDLSDLPELTDLNPHGFEEIGSHPTQPETPLTTTREEDLRELTRPLIGSDLDTDFAINSPAADRETSLNELSAETTPLDQPGWLSLLFSRAGILTLFGTALLGLGIFALSRFNSRSQPAVADSPQPTPVASNPTTPIPSPAASPTLNSPSPSPSLTPGEFSPPGLSSSSSLPTSSPSNSPASPTAVSTASPMPGASASPSPVTTNSPVAVPSSSPSSKPVLGMTQTASPRPTPAPTSFPVEPQAVSDYSYYYIVLSPYSKPQDYQKATQILSDAFLIRQGNNVKIQYAVFDSKEMAQELVTNLKRQGITATVLPPTAGQ